MMEYFVSSGAGPPLEQCLQKVEGADLLVVIVAHRYGWVPPDQPDDAHKSITWLECEAARAHGKEVLAFLADEKQTWPEGQREDHVLTAAMREGTASPELFASVQRNLDGLRALKVWLDSVGVRAHFTTRDDLWGQVSGALHHWWRRHRTSTPTPRRSADPAPYLRSLLETTSSIDIRGLQVGSGQAHRFPIDDLFMSLTTTAATASRSGKDAEKGKAGASPWDAASGRDTTRPLHTALSARRLVVVGDPGSGKSTFLRRVAHALCETRLGEVPGAARERLGVEGAPFPLLVRLPELAEHIATSRGATGTPGAPHRAGWLPHFLAAAALDGDPGLDEAFFRRHLERETCFVLLDGLDEASDRVTRESLSRLIEHLSTVYEQCHVVVTSRPGAYTGEAVLPAFAHARIDPLAADAVDTFLERWCQGLYPDSRADATRHQGELVAALSGRPEIRRMARNPVMLTALAVVHWNERRLPEQRADLYASIILWLSRSREQRPGRMTAERAVALMQELALAMHSHDDGRQVQVSKRWAAEAIAPEWREPAPKDRLALAERFLDDEELDSGIIVGRGPEVRFWHLTFQEFLAAKALAGRPEPEQREILFGQSRLYHPEWREVVLLLAGVLHQHQGSKTLDGFVGAVLDTLSSDATLADQARAVGLLGAMFRDLAAVGYAPTDRRYDTLLTNVLGIFDAARSAQIPVATRIEAADALGQAGDPRLDASGPDYWVVVPAGTFWMGAQNEDPNARGYDEAAYADEAPVHEVRLDQFRVARNLVTVAEFDRFVAAGGYDDERCWQAGGWGRFERPMSGTRSSRSPAVRSWGSAGTKRWRTARNTASGCRARLSGNGRPEARTVAGSRGATRTLTHRC
jgi:hypothetical protein